MLSDMIKHPSLVRLSRVLKVRRAEAIGLVELLYHATTLHHPDGGIGRLDHLDIAIACDWQGEDHDEFVAGLLNAGILVEVGGEAKYVVAEWSTRHAAEYVHRKLANGVQRFADGSDPNVGKLTTPQKNRLFDKWLKKYGEPHVADDRAPKGAKGAGKKGGDGANGRPMAPEEDDAAPDGANGGLTNTNTRANTLPCHTDDRVGQSPTADAADAAADAAPSDDVPSRAEPGGDEPLHGWGESWPVPTPPRRHDELPEFLRDRSGDEWTEQAWAVACRAAHEIESVEGVGVMPVVDAKGQGRAWALWTVLEAYQFAGEGEEFRTLKRVVAAVSTFWTHDGAPWLEILNGLRRFPDGALLSPKRQKGRQRQQANRMEQAERLSREPRWARMLDRMEDAAEGYAVANGRHEGVRP